MGNMQRSSSAWTMLGLLLASCGLLSASVGFGLGPFNKKPIELQSRQPAAVRLANTSLFFEGASTNKEYFPVQDSLLITLGTELISHEKTLVVKEKASDAEWKFSANITGYSVSPPGTRREQSGGTAMTYVVWSGSLHVAYRVIDKHGKVYDAANVDDDYRREFETSTANSGNKLDIFHLPTTKKKGEVPPGSPEDVKQILIKNVVTKIAAKLGNTTQSIEVQVAAGEENLTHAAEFMKNGLWSRALDALQKAPTFPKPQEEAFHQYDLGLVYEAMSYDSKSSTEQRENISKAADYYDKSLELNPNEKYFVQTIARARDAVARFQALDRMQKQDIQVEKASKAEAADGKTVGQAIEEKEREKQKESKSSKKISVDDVILLKSSDVSDDQIIDFINSATMVDFDPTDRDTMLAVAKAKLSIPVQNALRARVKAPLLNLPRQAAGPASKSATPAAKKVQ